MFVMTTTPNPTKTREAISKVMNEVRKDLDSLKSRTRTADDLMKGITLLLNQHMLKYNWVASTCLNRAPILPS